MLELIIFSTLNGLLYGLLLFLLASGLTLIFSMMGVLNFAHASFYMLGAYFGFQISLYVGYWPGLILAPLLVGGIGIMNIMLVSVTERTREIGLRLAVGARGRDIMTQFLVEAMTLATLGGALGVLLGIAISALVAYLANWDISLSIFSIVIAVSFSAAIGIFFGYYPAKKAAQMQPIVALRYE